MKLVVPLTIPCTRSTNVAASDSCRTRMTGTTPATAASKRSCTLFSRAHAHSSSPWRESSCLLAVTTWRPARIASSTYSRVGSTPPISSTISCEPSRISAKSPSERVSTPLTRGRSPVVCSTQSARSSSSATNADPTVPWPRTPTLKVSAKEVLVGLAAHDQSGVAVTAEDHRRPGHAVVVVGHREAVRAGRGRDHHVTHARMGQLGVADDNVAGLAVLADQMAGRPATEAVGDVGLVAGAVEHRPQVVRHAAVDRHPGRHVVLDRLDGVQRHARIGHQGAAGLVDDPHV